MVGQAFEHPMDRADANAEFNAVAVRMIAERSR